MHWGQYALFVMGLEYLGVALGYFLAQDWKMGTVMVMYGLANLMLAMR